MAPEPSCPDTTLLTVLSLPMQQGEQITAWMCQEPQGFVLLREFPFLAVRGEQLTGTQQSAPSRAVEAARAVELLVPSSN